MESQTKTILIDMWRHVFTVYWDARPPSTEMFFMRHGPLNLTRMADLEARIPDFLARQELPPTYPVQAIYIAAMPVQMSIDEIEAAGWRVIDF